HETLVPPGDARGYAKRAPPEWRTEFDVLRALRSLGHEVRVLGAGHALAPLLDAVTEFRPAVVFNLMVEFHGRADFDQHVASALELVQVPYTGCGPRGLTLARDKALSKELLRARGIDVPRFQVFARGERTRREPSLAFPLIVKSRTEEASLGIARGSLVTGEQALARAVRRIHEKVESDAIVEEYLDGRELYSAVLGGPKPRVFPTWELVFRHPGSHPRIATRAVKFSPPLQRRLGIVNRAARLPAALERRVHALARATWDALSLTGYARIDLRLTPTGRLAVLEANPNPELARGEDFADAARAAGVEYEELVAGIVQLTRRR
ncbi:MAG: D-alanine--D-alanine ligase, partial [Planctomycetota bacterium]